MTNDPQTDDPKPSEEDAFYDSIYNPKGIELTAEEDALYNQIFPTK